MTNLAFSYAEVAKLADAHALGACGVYTPCRFNSCLRHQIKLLKIT